MFRQNSSFKLDTDDAIAFEPQENGANGPYYAVYIHGFFVSMNANYFDIYYAYNKACIASLSLEKETLEYYKQLKTFIEDNILNSPFRMGSKCTIMPAAEFRTIFVILDDFYVKIKFNPENKKFICENQVHDFALQQPPFNNNNSSPFDTFDAAVQSALVMLDNTKPSQADIVEECDRRENRRRCPG